MDAVTTIAVWEACTEAAAAAILISAVAIEVPGAVIVSLVTNYKITRGVKIV